MIDNENRKFWLKEFYSMMRCREMSADDLGGFNIDFYKSIKEKEANIDKILDSILPEIDNLWGGDGSVELEINQRLGRIPIHRKHEDFVRKYDGSLEDLAVDLGNLKYDALADFLLSLSKKIQEDGEKDKNRGRIKLASSLFSCSEKMNEASQDIKEAWRICKPYMKD